MQTCKDMLPAIGQTVLVRCEDMQVACIVADVKSSWGNTRLYVIPVAGCRGQWVEMARIAAVPASMALAGATHNFYRAGVKV